MDLLGAYGSDSDGEDASSAQAPVAAPKRSGLLSALPPPKNDGAPAAQPSQQAAAAGKRVVAFTVPLKTDALTAPPDEDERPRKRAAVSAGPGSGLSALLPKPVHDDLGGFSSTGGTKLDFGGGSAAAPQAAHPSAAFRVDAAPQGGGQEAPHPSLLYAVTSGCATTAAERASWAQQQAAWDGGDGGGQGGWQGEAHRGGVSDVDALLAQAIEEDRQRGGPAGSAAARLAALGRPQVVEVSQAELTAGRDRLLATKSVTGAAFGPEAEARLRAEAGPKPSDVQRRKHQIGSLLHDAKVQELKALEGRLQGMKSKRETMAKYGW